ncbi:MULTISPECIES: hypothetical protein [Pseudonocardia]|uniref:ATP synthase I chain n=2 Tax=Pseudonocardia TaxID=1847 RepID=A0A1Y2N8Q3_PSEAH|nr:MULTISPECIES: hypothetical protein [Pseudonocardia]OSY43447.1 hypothetical protein BG845_00390 [Pseudonocardia autotrophica]TDN73557.1 hypothetical protein C8E95_2659 [Pseudonocardia autotrophica]BBG04302.1 hypothetical protein Pdca_55110 [Pseudonocardia autotrophica]GEC25555.1 hypothetical protein PSA01_25840 [Pseudonocardia saturnea]
MWRLKRPELVVGHEQAMRRLSASMARNAALLAVLVGAGCVIAFTLLAGRPGLSGAGVGALTCTVFGLLTSVLVRGTAEMPPRFVMLASVTGWLTKSLILFGVLFALGRAPWLDRDALVVTLLLGMIATAAGEAWAAYRMRILVGEVPAGPSA